MVKVLVLGATGYLGIPLCNALRRASHQVYGVVRSDSKRRTLAKLEVTPVLGSSDEPENYISLIKSANIDVVIDASGAQAGATKILKDVSRAGEERLVAASGGRVAKLGFVAVTGMWLHGDSQTPVNDLTPIGVPSASTQPPAMLAWRPEVEQKILAASEVLNVAIARPALMYGNGQPAWGMYFGSLRAAALSKQPSVELSADPATMMGLVHVEDVGSGITAIVDKLELLDGRATFPIFNFVSSYENLGVVLKTAATYLGFKGLVKYTSPEGNYYAEAFSTTVNGDSNRARSLLGWSSRTGTLTGGMDVYAATYIAASDEKSF
ncbi:MAG: hypothetical protein M1825_005937 [Sarcosagium campestre]|nr:MAG: hypothetical protein M1825_005937 [Sarcosagium campestre]